MAESSEAGVEKIIMQIIARAQVISDITESKDSPNVFCSKF